MVSIINLLVDNRDYVTEIRNGAARPIVPSSHSAAMERPIAMEL